MNTRSGMPMIVTTSTTMVTTRSGTKSKLGEKADHAGLQRFDARPRGHASRSTQGAPSSTTSMAKRHRTASRVSVEASANVAPSPRCHQ